MMLLKPKKIFVKSDNLSGFSLLELSLVIIVISLTIISTLVGRGMVEIAQISRAKMITNSSPVGGINNIKIWLETTDPGAFIRSNNSIATWRDRALGNNLNQSSYIMYPKFASASVEILPAVEFDGINDFLERSTSSYESATSLFIVYRSNKDQIQSNSLFSSSNSNDRNTYQISYGASGMLEFSGNSNLGSSFSYAIESSVNQNANIVSIIMDGISSVESYLNSELVFSINRSDGFLVKYNTYKLGVNRNGTSYFGGYIAEFILYERAVSEEERKEVEKYLSNKYNIKLS